MLPRHHLSIKMLLFLLGYSIVSKAQVADFSSNVTSGCAPLVVQFNNLSTGATSYYWDLGNLATSTQVAPSTTYTTPGTYTVMLTAYNGPNSNTKTVVNYITVYAQPVVSFYANDTTVCPGEVVSFTNTSNPMTAGNATYYWDFGDGNHSTVQNPTHAYAIGGYYSVTLTVTNSQGCAATHVIGSYIHVFTKPSAQFTCPTTTFCNPPGTVTFINTSTGPAPLTYLWLFGDNTTSTAATPPAHTYGSGSFTVTLVVTSADGCVDSLVRTNYINVQTNTGNFSYPPSACQGETVTFTNTSPPPITSSIWNFGDNTTGVGATVSHTYTSSGTYQVQLATQAACADTVYHTIVINPKPLIDFNYTPLHPCPAPDTLFFNNLTVNGGNYMWYFGDGDSSNLVNPSHVYGVDTYSVMLVSTNNFGCTDTLLKPGYIHLAPFILNAVSDVPGGCPPVTVNFYYTTSYTDPVISQVWDFGDNTTSTQATPSHTYVDTGVYTVTVTVVSANGCTQTDSLEIQVGLHATPDFTAIPTEACTHESIQFINNSTNATGYFWIFGDGFTSADTSPVHQYLDDGTFTIKLVAFNNGCPDTLVVDTLIHIHPSTAKFNILYSCDTPKKVTLLNSSSPFTSFTWSFGDNTFSTVDTSPVHQYASLGSYFIKLVTINSIYGCKDSITQTANIIDPIPKFYALDTSLCLNSMATFYANIDDQGGPSLPVYNYTWTTDSVTTNTVIYPFYNYLYSTAGIYDATLEIYDSHGCPHSYTNNQYMLIAQPVVGFAAVPTDGCAPLNVQFTDTSTDQPGTFDSLMFWDFGIDTLTVNTAVANYTYANAGSYYVKLVVTDNVGCKDSLIKFDYIHVNHPTASFLAANVFPCMYDTARFINTSSGVAPLSYYWDFGDNSTSTLSDPTHVYTDTGAYTITLVVTDSTGCSDTLVQNQYIQITRPHAQFMMDDSVAVCAPMHVNFTSTSPDAVGYRWDFGNTNTSILADPTNVYVTPGDYTVRFIALDEHDCPDTAYGHVKLLGYDGAFTYTPTEGCTPLLISFTANVTNVDTLIWDFGDGNTVVGNTTISHVYQYPGTYLPILIFGDSSGCHSISLGLDTLRLDGLVTDYEFSPNPVCTYDHVMFRDTFPDIVQYSWLFDNGDTSDLPQPVYYYNTPGEHAVRLVVFNNTGCSDTVAKSITVNPLPAVVATGDTIICEKDRAELSVEGATYYNWIPPEHLTCPICSLTYADPRESTTYIVTGTDEHGCQNTDTVQVDLKECNCIVSMPTAFTPNGDGKNDRFAPIVTDMVSVHMEVFNRWGQPVFYTTYPGHSWDGTYKGVACDAGTYYYFVKVKCTRGQEVLKKGDVTLVR